MELSRVEREIKSEFPSFTVIPKKESRLMGAIDVALRIISFGQLRYFKRFITTIGTTVYVPEHWSALEPGTRAAVLRHELVHMRQSRKYGKLWFSFLYLFVPLPAFLAYYRMKFEQEAYAESLRAYNEYGVDIRSPRLRESILSHFLTASYLWMWPFKKSLNAWYDRTVEDILRRTP